MPETKHLADHRFKPGQSGNPGGKTPDAFRAYAKRKLNGPHSLTYLQAVVEAAFRKAMKGDSKVLPYVCDRLFGKVTQPVEITGMEQLGERISAARSRLAPAAPPPETAPNTQPEAQEPTIQ